MRFWRDNRVDAEHEVSEREVVAGFFQSQYATSKFDGYPHERRLRAYLTAKDGLSSVWEDDAAFDRVLDTITDEWEDHA